jgi:hypothetical protein
MRDYEFGPGVVMPSWNQLQLSPVTAALQLSEECICSEFECVS